MMDGKIPDLSSFREEAEICAQYYGRNLGVDFMKNDELPFRWMPYRDYVDRRNIEEMMINRYIAGVDPYAMRRNNQFINTAQIAREIEEQEYPNEDGIFK